ncbi:endoribonuclease L-PSP [Rhizobium favelukesii]|uniref:Endoribonuclease L-PSP n=1 Tax=Rhizobium favelukesii TaxID=348824 RepID=W6R6G9_9HYPH|nr:endoribonuclease L-PSP [Rhizobium favelukesii]
MKIGNLPCLSAMVSVVGHEPQVIGRVGAELSAEDGRKTVEIAALSAVAAIRAHLGSFDKVSAVAKLGSALRR